jgi:hypothetical protein
LAEAEIERKAFRLWRDGAMEKALATLTNYAEGEPGPDAQSKGWLLQFAGRVAHHWGRNDLAQNLQRQAFILNHNLTRAQSTPPYVALPSPGEQAAAIIALLARFTFRRALLSEFDEVVSLLTAGATANQFEESLAKLGRFLGFRSERPDNTYRVGPDVLWLMEGNRAWVIEAKSRKQPGNPLTKNEHGQLLNAVEWFKAAYPGFTHIPVSAHPNTMATRHASPHDARHRRAVPVAGKRGVLRG